MAAHFPLIELAHTLQQHLTFLAPLQKQDQPDVRFQEIEQALTMSETTVFIYGEAGKVRRLPVIGTYLCDRPGETDLLIVDEFDEVRTEGEQKRFAAFIQQLTEQQIPTHFMLCGVSESVRELLKPHESSYDYAQHDQSLEANVPACISRTRDQAYDADTAHHVYFLSEKLFWEMFSDPTFARSFH